mgnify:CR=1 FL=1
MNAQRILTLISAAGTGWFPGASYRSGWTACPGCGADDIETGSYAADRACWIVTRCRTCGHRHTMAWLDAPRAGAGPGADQRRALRA